MEEKLDEDGRSRVPSRSTSKKKNGLDDLVVADTGPALDSPGGTVDQGPNHPKAISEESRPHGVKQNRCDGAAGAFGNPDDAPQSGSNSGYTRSEAISIVPDGIIPVYGNPITAEVVQSLSNVALGGTSNPNDVAQVGLVGIPGHIASGVAGNSVDDAPGAVQNLSDVAPGADVSSLYNVAPGVSPENAMFESVMNSDSKGLIAAPNFHSVAYLARISSDVAVGPVQNPGNVERSEIVELEQDSQDDTHEAAENHCIAGHGVTETTDEALWWRAVAEQDCSKLSELLAKDVAYFWKYEKNGSATALHAAATGGDVELAERILNLLSWAQDAGDLDMRFSDTTLHIDRYVELKTNEGKTATELAQENEQKEIKGKISDYVDDKDLRTSNKEIFASTGSSINRASPMILEWNDAIKKKDCLALLESLDKVMGNSASGADRELLRKVELENGKKGRQTALQTAAMQGCLDLAILVINWHVNGSTQFEINEYVSARDNLSGLTAFEMVNDVTGNTSIRYHIENCRYYFENIRRFVRANDHRISMAAYPGTRWQRALERRQTHELEKLVAENSSFVFQTWHGLTVWHAAILSNDLKMVKMLLKLCDEVFSFNLRKSVMFAPFTSLHLMMTMKRKIDHGYVKEYWEYATKSWQPIAGSIKRQLETNGYSVKGFAAALQRIEILKELGKFRGIDESFQGSTMPSRLHTFFAKNWMPAFDDIFQKDVDFNFESQPRREWLRFHHACKDPLKFRDFLHEMAFYISQHPYDATKLLQTWDGKGRTPFHILMDHHNDQKEPGWPFDEIFNHKCFEEWIQTVENPRGKRLVDTILTKNYLQRNGMIQPWAYYKVKFNHETFERVEATTFLYYQVAYLLNQKDMVQEIWTRFLEKKKLRSVMEKDQAGFNSMLFLAASTGNQSCLQLLLEINHDPMITDSNGRSLLHHAADPTILLSQLLGHCSLTVEDVVGARRKFMESNTTYYPQLSSSTTSNGNCNGFDNVQQNGSNLTSMYGITKSNNPCAQVSNTLDSSLGERSNVGRKACILMLLQAGVDLGQPDNDNEVPAIGPSIDATFQSWWYDMVVKDSTEKKNAMSQGGNALSVVGALVAATSYVGPLQPPLGFDSGGTGFVKTTEPLIKVFMVSNSVAFYFAMASVMFAMVSSLPMPQEGVMSELNRARHVISISLCLLQIAIGSVIISFAMASIVAIQNEQLFQPSDLLFYPSIIGWYFCLLGIHGFVIRWARLIFYRNPIVRSVYQFSLAKYLWKILNWLLFAVCHVIGNILYCLGDLCNKIPLAERINMDWHLWLIGHRFHRVGRLKRNANC